MPEIPRPSLADLLYHPELYTEVDDRIRDHIADAGIHGGEGGAHPNLATHEALGLVTDTDLADHAATPHGGGSHPDLATHDTLGLATQDELDAHELAADPHTGYALDSDLTTHAGAADPHTGYQKESEKGVANGYASLDSGGKIPDSEIPATIARDSELPDLAGHVAAGDPHTGYQRESEKAAASGYASLDGTTKVPIAQLPTGTSSSTVALGDAVANHAAAGDPHTGYRLESADHTHASSGAQAGTIDHGVLTGLTDDDHPQYLLESVPISRGGTLHDVAGVAVVNLIVWRAPFACTVSKVWGYRVGGTGATINARKNNASNHLASALSLTSTDTWMDGGSVQNTSYAAGDEMEIMVVSVTGTVTQIGIQVDLVRA